MNDKAVRGTNFTCFHAGPKEDWTQYRMEPPEVPRPASGKLFLPISWGLRVWRRR